MKYYANYNKNLDDLTKSNSVCLNEEIENIEITEEIFNNFDDYKYDNGEIVEKSEEEKKQEKEQKRQEHIKSLQCTKRVFALMLQELGISYSQLKELINSNEQAQLEWELCVELLRSNPMLDLMAGQLGITSEQLDNLFLYANGEITKEEFKNN